MKLGDKAERFHCFLAKNHRESCEVVRKDPKHEVGKVFRTACNVQTEMTHPSIAYPSTRAVELVSNLTTLAAPSS